MKKFKIVMSVVCILLCVLPFACMSFAKTESTTQNRKLAEMPLLVDNEKFNFKYLQQLGNYFEDHYAGKNIMVNADSVIQGDLFKVSNADTVVKGNNGWLYYADTLDDYMSKAKLSENGVCNAARNIYLMQEYVKSKNAKFVLAVPPNKNSLYGENMPYYYSGKYNDEKTVKSFEKQLKNRNVNNVDLFSLFGENNETLYLKRDSHWNNKGAMLVYNDIMDNLNVVHNNYLAVKAIREKTAVGDLNKMLYPLSAQPEWDYYYQIDDNYNYKYVTDTNSVEDAWIETKSNSKNGKLLMFRDSFGNSLLPFFAREFGSAYFSKGVPYSLESYMENYSPDYVVVEKVERNIDEFAFDPPVFSLPSDYKISSKCEKTENKANFSVSSYEGDLNYIMINGTIDDEYIGNESDIFVSVNDKVYTAFSISNDTSDNGFRVYLKKDDVNGMSDVCVIVSSNGKDNIVKTEKIDFNKFI